MSTTSATYSVRTLVRIVGIREHKRILRGRRTHSGEAYTEEVNMGWFLHLEFVDSKEPLGVAIGVGTDRPPFSEGELLQFSLEKVRG